LCQALQAALHPKGRPFLGVAFSHEPELVVAVGRFGGGVISAAAGGGAVGLLSFGRMAFSLVFTKMQLGQ